ncbi:Bifunctional epoxide hydrolase 2, partial [Trichoplax sp. H2]
GLLAGLPEKLHNCFFMSDKEFNYCVEKFKKHGFHYSLNWYRNEPRNWKCLRSFERYMIYQPSSMITAEYDPILLSELTKGMEQYIPNLTRANLLCGHWTQSECPAELNCIFSKWLPKVSAN